MYRTLRSAHLERARDIGGITILYRLRRNDFDDSLMQGLDVRRVDPLRCGWLLLRGAPSIVEVNEPLMLPAAPTALLALLCARTGARLQRRRVPVVTYAIENLDPRGSSRPGFPARLRHRAQVFAAKRLAAGVDRVAFGTAGAETLYRSSFQRLAVDGEVRRIAALPAPCPCPPGTRVPTSVLFLGALEPRKGADLLMQAWPLVRARVNDATLVVVGTGPLAADAAALAATTPGVRIVTAPPRSLVHAELRAAEVLVLPSQPAPRWREQVGLPLVEGWAHGCRLVSTDQTGIADALATAGHTVIPAGGSAGDLAAAVVAALQSGRDETSVLADLPPEDGRAAAERWLVSGVVGSVVPHHG